MLLDSIFVVDDDIDSALTDDSDGGFAIAEGYLLR